MTNIYQTKRWETLRKQILSRDNFTCQFCGQLCLGKKRNGFSPTVDHIKPVKERPELMWEPSNLRVLCKSCDNKRHSEKGRGYDVPEVGLDGFPVNSEWNDG